jgi:hypothetical protein
VAPRRHEWRKREKDRLYAVTLLNGAWPRDRKRRKKRGEELGDALGRERDALLLIERLNVEPHAAGSEKASRHALAALKRQCHTLGRRADRIGARLHRDGA